MRAMNKALSQVFARKVQPTLALALKQAYGKLTLPPEFSWFEYDIYADNTTNYHPDLFRPIGGITYYVKPDGNNSNDGKSWDTALASPATAMQKSDCQIVMLAAGRYPKAFWGDITSQSNFRAMICDGGVAEFLASNLDDSANFVADAANPGAYKWSNVGTVYSVRDESILNEFGVWSRLGWAANAAACAATPGTRHTDGTHLWVHLADNRAPDDKIRVNTQRRAFVGIDANATYYKNIRWLGGVLNIGGLYQAASRVHMLNCHAAYTTSGQGDAALLSALSNTISYYYNCKTYGCELDGFSLQGSAKGVEVNCEAFDMPIAGSNNASTMHGSASAVLIGGYYHDTAGDVIASVSTGAVLCVGVIARSCPGTAASDWNSTSGPMWLINCANPESISDYSMEGNGAKYVQNCQFSLPIQNAQPVAVELYTGPGVLPSISNWTN